MRKLIVVMTFVVGMLAFSPPWRGAAHAQPGSPTVANPTIQVFVLCLDVNGDYTTYSGDKREIEFIAPLPRVSEGHLASTTESAQCLNVDDLAISGGYVIEPSDARDVSVTESLGVHSFGDFWRVTVVRR